MGASKSFVSLRRHHLTRSLGPIVALAAIVTMILAPFQLARAATSLTVKPLTWNVVGLDSNNVNTGPSTFPVGARVCNTGDTAAANVTSSFVWDDGLDPFSGNTYVNLRSGSSESIPLSSLAGGACHDFYFEVSIARNSAAYDHSRRYHIKVTADGGISLSTAVPREIYVEHLISQSRNSVTDVKLDGVSIPAGGKMSLLVGSTYTIQLVGATATNGYEQIESYITLPNTIFRVNSVATTYTANAGTDPDALTKPYANGCTWVNDPNSPNYRSCLATGKYGGNITVTYNVTVISGAGTTQTLNSLIYDFSGSSYHYNADYSVGGRIAAIVDPAGVTIAKAFVPATTRVNGVSKLTFTLHNPNSVALNGANFTDTFPTTPGAMVTAAPATYSTSGCGIPTLRAPIGSGSFSAGAGSLSFSNGTIAANGDCIISVNVTPPAEGSYTNTSDHLFIGTVDTGRTAGASLTVNTAPTPPACTPGLELARWEMDPGQGTGVPPAYFWKAGNVASASAVYSGTGTSAIDTTTGLPAANSWGVTGGWATDPTGYPNPNATYFGFSLDTSKFTAVRIAYNFQLAGNWAAKNNNFLYGYSSADGGGFSTIATVNPVDKQAGWTAFPATAALATGTNTTQFRINAVGQQNATAQLSLDNVVFTGCGVPLPPNITKAFGTNPIAVGSTSVLTFSLGNTNSITATGVTFTDDLPAGLEVASSPLAGTTCGGAPTWAPTAGATALTFGSPTGAVIPAKGSCTVTVSIKATTAGPHNNVSGYVSSAEGGTNTGASGSASASLTAILPPQIAKRFAPNPIVVNGISTLSFTIANPNPDNALNGVAISDTYPTNVVNAAPPAITSTCGGVVTATASSNIVSLSGGALAAGASCTVTVNVTSGVAGEYANTSGNVSAAIAGNGNTAADTLTVTQVHPGISVLKQVSTSSSGPWGKFVSITGSADIYYRFTIENTGDVALTSVSVSDPALAGTDADPAGCSWPNPLPVASPTQDPTATCVRGPISAASSGSHPNTATAHGTYSSTIYNSAPSTATYAVAKLTLVKSVTESNFTAAGDVLHYAFVVTNSGDAPLAGPVAVADDQATDESCPAVSTVGDGDDWLDPGESITCMATYTVQSTDRTNEYVTNIASATAGGTTSNTDTKTVNWAAADYGDLPSSYNDTLQSDNGARHTIGNLYLGACVTADPDGQPSANADADSCDDGVTRTGNWSGGAGSVDVTVTEGHGCLMGWLDYWNGSMPYVPDNDFADPGEVIVNNQPVSTGTQSLGFALPSDAVSNAAWFARFRLVPDQDDDGDCSDQAAVGLTGLANNGEAEDYRWGFGPTAVSLSSLTAGEGHANQSWWMFPVVVGGLLIGAALRVRRRKA